MADTTTAPDAPVRSPRKAWLARRNYLHALNEAYEAVRAARSALLLWQDDERLLAIDPEHCRCDVDGLRPALDAAHQALEQAMDDLSTVGSKPG